jgi:hypothetical protein
MARTKLIKNVLHALLKPLNVRVTWQTYLEMLELEYFAGGSEETDA